MYITIYIIAKKNREPVPKFSSKFSSPRGIPDRLGKPAQLTAEATPHAETLPRRRRQYPPFVITVRARERITKSELS